MALSLSIKSFLRRGGETMVVLALALGGCATPSRHSTAAPTAQAVAPQTRPVARVRVASRPASRPSATKPHAKLRDPFRGCPKPRYRCEPGCPQAVYGRRGIKTARDAWHGRLEKGVSVRSSCVASAACYETLWRRIAAQKKQLSVIVFAREMWRASKVSPRPALRRLRHWLEQRHKAGRPPIRLGLCAARNEELEDLAALPGVRSLAIQQMRLGGAGLRRLGKAAALRSITASCSAFDDEALRWAATLPRLTTLELGSTKVTSLGLQALRGSRALRWLDLFDTAVDRQIASVLRTLPRLEFLNLSETPIDASVCHALDGLPLRALYLAWRKKCAARAPILDAQCIRTIGGLSQLRWLVLNSWPLRGVDLASLHKLDKLRYLDLARTGVTRGQLEAIAKLPALEVLQLVGNTLDARDLLLLRGLRKLRRLSVSPRLLPAAKRLLPGVKVEGRWFFWIEGMKATVRRSRTYR